MKRRFQRELIWLIAALLLSLPLAYLALYLLETSRERSSLVEGERVFVLEFFLIYYVLFFVGIYLLRLLWQWFRKH